MKNKFCDFETACYLKDLGFDEEFYFAVYYVESKVLDLAYPIYDSRAESYSDQLNKNKLSVRRINLEKGWAIKAPLVEEAIDWLRLTYGVSYFDTVNLITEEITYGIRATSGRGMEFFSKIKSIDPADGILLGVGSNLAEVKLSFLRSAVFMIKNHLKL